jgi:hypothetical protein
MRIAVIGNSGGGKSGLARVLAQRHGLPYVEIDAFLWQPGWQRAPVERYTAAHARWLAADDWVMDGLGRRESITARLARATAIVLVDLPVWVHFQLAAERQIAWAAGTLAHPPAGIAQMPPTAGLFETIWTVDRDWLPALRAQVRHEEAAGKAITRIESLAALDAALE